MEYNLSNDTMVTDKLGNPVVYPVDLEHLIAGTQDMSFAKELNYSVPATGVCFRKDKQGILPYLCETLYADRKATKRRSLQMKNEHEKIVEELRHRGVEI